MKLKLLFCSEASILSTGYAVLAKEFLTRLHATGKYEIAEYARYVHDADPRLKDVPWKVYGVLPHPNDEEGNRIYNSSQVNVFGGWKFEDVVLDFMPNVVFGYADYWMDEHQARSPLRPYYNLVWMPTVDAYPQNKQWIASHAECDAIFTYSDWAIDVLKEQSGGKINPLCSLPAGADITYTPVENKIEHKKKYGLENHKIIGTVMRNQRRKLFPDLFLAFRKFLDESKRQDILLYCHTSYPDKHPWNIPELINEYSLSNKILMTYFCSNCGYSFPSFYKDIYTVCERCNNLSAQTSNVQKGSSSAFMREIYNLFDIYIQYANSEGQGLPQCEAASCGVPVMSVDYSAMSDVVRKLNGYPIKVKTLYRELETGCFRAAPDNDNCVDIWTNFFSHSDEEQLELGKKAKEAYEQNYGYDKSVAKFMAYLDSLDINTLNSKWLAQPDIREPAQPPNILMTDSEFANFLMINVLGDPSKIGSYMHCRLIKELNIKATTGGMGGYYINENSLWFADNQIQKFSREDAYNNFSQMRQIKNHWERQRWERINGK
jgi:glycosyltransferase involved in cell wall biosynthesis